MVVTGKILPTGNGTYTAWTGDYQDVDEDPHDNDTTRISSNTANQVETVTHGGNGYSGTINKVTVYVVAKASGMGVSNIQIRVRSGSTDLDGGTAQAPAQSITSSYDTYSAEYTEDPDTSNDWTVSGVDNMEFGIIDELPGFLQTQYCTQMYIIVTYGIAPAPTPTPSVSGFVDWMEKKKKKKEPPKLTPIERIKYLSKLIKGRFDNFRWRFQ